MHKSVDQRAEGGGAAAGGQYSSSQPRPMYPESRPTQHPTNIQRSLVGFIGVCHLCVLALLLLLLLLRVDVRVIVVLLVTTKATRPKCVLVSCWVKSSQSSDSFHFISLFVFFFVFYVFFFLMA